MCPFIFFIIFYWLSFSFKIKGKVSQQFHTITYIVPSLPFALPLNVFSFLLVGCLLCCDDICLGFGLLVRGIVIIDSCGRCFFFQISKGSTTCFVSIQNLKLVYKKKAKEGAQLQFACKMWQRSHKSSEERKLELRLGPPGEESLNESIRKCNRERRRNESPLTLGCFSTQKIFTSDTPGPGGAMLPSAWPSTSYHHQHQAKAKASSFLQLQSSPQNMIVMGKDVSQFSCVEKKVFSPSCANPAVSKRYPCFSLFLFKALKLQL